MNAARALGVLGLIVLGSLLAAAPVAAECSWLPPWPPASEALRSAKSVVVGEVALDIAEWEKDLPIDFTTRHRVLQVREVLRGDVAEGATIDLHGLLPNWPWGQAPDPIPSCRSISVDPREVIVLALDALQPRQTVSDGGGLSWIQPPTRYNAMSVISLGPDGDRFPGEREFLALEQVRALAALPPTDAEAPPVEPSISPVGIVVGAGLLGFVIAMRRLRRASARRRH